MNTYTQDVNKNKLLSKYVFYVYNSLYVVMLEACLAFITAAIFIFPYLLQTYVPMIIASYYVPAMMTFGLHLAIFLENDIYLVIISFIMSILAIMTIIWAEVETFSFTDAFQAKRNPIAIPSYITKSHAPVWVNLTYTPVNTPSTPSQGIYLIGIYNIILTSYLITRALFTSSALMEYARIQDRTDTEVSIIETTTMDNTNAPTPYKGREEEAPMKKEEKECCTSVKSIHIILIITFASCLCVICTAEWILGLVMISNAIQILNPINYNSLLQAFICIPLICIPIPRKLNKNERIVNVSKNKKSLSSTELIIENMRKAQHNNQDYLIDNVPIQLMNDRYIILITLSVFVIFALLLSMYHLTSQAIWLFRNGANLYSEQSLQNVMTRDITLNFTNVRSFKYQLNEGMESTLSLNTYAYYTYAFAVLDMINLVLTLVLFVLVYIYLYRVLSTRIHNTGPHRNGIELVML